MNEQEKAKDQEEESRSETEVIDQEVLDDEETVEVLTGEDHIDDQLQALTDEKEQLQDRLLRVQAEFDNFKRRTEKERIAERKYKSQEVITELLPVLDNFERALQTEVTEENKGFAEGIQMVYNQFLEALTNQGVEVIEAVNKEFDPNMHHAVMQVEEESFDSNIVVEELQKGFILKEKVIRPAMVKVNK